MPVSAPAPAEQVAERPYVTGTYDEAVQALRIPVPRPSWLPPGAVLRELDFSARPTEPWSVQRYLVGGEVLFVSGELAPKEDVAIKAEAEVTVHGRPALVYALRRPDGGVGEWTVTWRTHDVSYTVGGPFSVDLLLQVAGGLR